MFVNHFRKTYLGDDKMLTNHQFLSIIFTTQNKPNTTNVIESWHRSVNFRCNIPHDNFGGFV